MEGYYTDNTLTTVGGDLDKFRSVNVSLPAGTYTLAFSSQVRISVFTIKNGTYNTATTLTHAYGFTLNDAADISIGFSLAESPIPDWDDSTIVCLNEGDYRVAEPYGYKIPIIIDGENLFDKNNPSVFIGEVSNQKWRPISSSRTIRISCQPSTDYTLSFESTRTFSLATIATDELPSDYPSVTVIGRYYDKKRSFTTAADAKYLLISLAESSLNAFLDELQVNYGSEILPTTTNIFIDTPLGTGETVSLVDSGVNVPTTYGLNTLSIDGEVQPSTVKIKYE